MKLALAIGFMLALLAVPGLAQTTGQKDIQQKAFSLFDDLFATAPARPKTSPPYEATHALVLYIATGLKIVDIKFFRMSHDISLDQMAVFFRSYVDSKYGNGNGKIEPAEKDAFLLQKKSNTGYTALKSMIAEDSLFGGDKNGQR